MADIDGQTTTARARLSVRDETKPVILIAAVVVGIVLNRLLGGGASGLLWVVEIGVFFVIIAVMLPVEIKDVSRALRKVKPTAIALAINFLFIPLFIWVAGWLFLRQFPDVWAGVILYALTPCIGWYLILYLAIILGPIVELPMLPVISRVLLGLRSRLWSAQPPAPRVGPQPGATPVGKSS